MTSVFGDLTPTIEGDENGNQLIGTAGDDVINGNGGGDQLLGNGGNDILTGGEGDDILIGGEGNDVARFDDKDAFVTISEDPEVEGRIIATREVEDADGNTVIEENQLVGVEQVVFGAGGGVINVPGITELSILEGGAGDDFLFGAVEDDLVNAGAGNDFVLGRLGNDVLNGDAGMDILFGGEGNDVLNGGADNDGLLGGVGSDTFVFQTGGANDVVSDFTSGDDQVYLAVAGVDNFADVLAVASEANGGTVLDFGNGDSLTLANVAVEELDAADFLFG